MDNVTFTQIAAGINHSVGVGPDGNTYAWGNNNSGQLGDGTTTNRTVPVVAKAPAGVTFTQIAAGYYHSMAVGSDGKTYAWGNNNFGQLGDGTTTDRAVPVVVQAPAGVTFTQIAAGAYHSLAVGSDGNTYAWGYNGLGELGNGTTTDSEVPVMVQAPAGVTFTQIAAGFYHSLAVGSDGNTYAWGYNRTGQLGNGTTTNSEVPVMVQAPAGVTFTQIAVGFYHSMAVGSDGNTYAWGNNTSGQLGDGTTTDRAVPMVVQAPAGVTFTQIAAGAYHSLAVGSDGNSYAWGFNGLGDLGNGTTTDSEVPVMVQAPAGVTFTQIAAGADHSLAVGSDGNTYAWGSNNSGQLGDGTTTNRAVPVLVQAPSRTVVVTSVSFGGAFGQELVDNGDGTVSVTTPAHAAGPVDVVVSWTLNGIEQQPVTYSDGFTFLDSVVFSITDPQNQTVADGADASFTVAVTSASTADVTWEVSTDDGATWEQVAPGASLRISEDGLTLTVTGDYAQNAGSLYRAVARNGVDPDVVSAGALLTVIPADTNGGDNSHPANHAVDALAATGSVSTGPLIALGALALFGGVAVLVVRRSTTK
ncbi:RCC1 domain-containing protein [Leifsonia aquatica]|uniref:RCC1 domain-containing protein n=1 Tax=Leifsonia aquatica TaxID=144185 RepID=UPI0037F5F39D